MSLSTAPLHFFVRLKDDNQIYNFEATAGGLKANASYKRDYLITDKALKNGLYLQSLTKKEAVGAMAIDIGLKYLAEKKFKEAHAVGDIILKYYPNYPSAMHLKGNIWHQMLTRDLDAAKKKRIRISHKMHKHFQSLLKKNLHWFTKAENLGWREPPQDYEDRYLKMIQQVRMHYE